MTLRLDHLADAILGWHAALRAYLVVLALGSLIGEAIRLPLGSPIFATLPSREALAWILGAGGADLISGAGALTAALALAGSPLWPQTGARAVAIATLILAIGWAGMATLAGRPPAGLVGAGLTGALAQGLIVPGLALLAASYAGRRHRMLRDR